MVRDPRMVEQAEELRHESRMYEFLRRSAAGAQAVPEYFGFSDHCGVPLLCVAAEGDDFEDIGLDNIPHSLKRSAVAALKRISDCGVLHGDVALRNIVRSAQNPNHAKFIDFGRARMTDNATLLAAQVANLIAILGVSAGTVHNGLQDENTSRSGRRDAPYKHAAAWNAQAGAKVPMQTTRQPLSNVDANVS